MGRWMGAGAADAEDLLGSQIGQLYHSSATLCARHFGAVVVAPLVALGWLSLTSTPTHLPIDFSRIIANYPWRAVGAGLRCDPCARLDIGIV